MTETLTVNSAVKLAQAHRALDAMWGEHKYLEIEIKRKAGQRTLQQNAAMHLFFDQLADVLNDAGYDMRRTLRHDVDIPWTRASVKKHLWRPIQKAMTEKDSTTEITTLEPTDIHATLTRHLAERLGVNCPPWPDRNRRDAA